MRAQRVSWWAFLRSWGVGGGAWIVALHVKMSKRPPLVRVGRFALDVVIGVVLVGLVILVCSVTSLPTP